MTSKRFPILLPLIFIFLLCLPCQTVFCNCFYRNLPRPAIRAPGQFPWVALTFDDGPHGWETPELLDLLDELEVKATFFLVGKEVLKYPHLVEQIIQRGHCIGNHSFRHWNLPRLDRETIYLEWSYCNQCIARITGKNPRFCRPPGGNYSRDVLLAAEQAGLYTVLWDINSYDSGEGSPEQIVSTVTKRMKPGSIILFHDGFQSTLKALPQIVKAGEERNLSFVTLDQLFFR